MTENEVTYTHELIDFPDADELRAITTSKEELFKAKKRSFIMSIGGDIAAKAKNQGEHSHSATLAHNFLGLNEQEQTRMLNEVTDFIKKQGYKVEITETTLNNMTAKTIKIDWTPNA
jgi:hypothetical protein